MNHNEWIEQQNTTELSVGRHDFELAYAEFGSGEPVSVFLHGIPTWGFLFRAVVDGVDHAIVPDLPGYGYTRHLGAGGYDRSVRVMEETTSALLDGLGIGSATLIGHDLGGSAALRLAVHSDVVDRLVLSNAGFKRLWSILLRRKRLSRFSHKLRINMSSITALLILKKLSNPALNSPIVM
jgi:pimeloyl-ACP methyl ester carboxylesterase